jgi:hypothetical protein
MAGHFFKLKGLVHKGHGCTQCSKWAGMCWYHHHQWLYSPCKNLGRLTYRGFVILLRHTAGLLWTSGQPVAKASTYTRQHNIQTQETNIHALSGIRTHDPSNQAAADLRLRPRGHWDRHMLVYHTELFFCSWISHRHLSIYTISNYLFFFRFFWRYILAPFLGTIPALVYFHFEHWFHLINFWNTTQTCEIWSSHGGCKDESLVGYGAVKSRRSRPRFWGAYCLHYQGNWFVPVIQCPIQEVQRKIIALVEAARISETPVYTTP